MKAGLWQLVIWGVLVLILFRPVILTLVRVVARLRRESAERAQGTVERRPPPAFTWRRTSAGRRRILSALRPPRGLHRCVRRTLPLADFFAILPLSRQRMATGRIKKEKGEDDD